MAPFATVYWHRPLGAPDTVRRLTIGRPCWSTSSKAPVSLHVLEVDCPRPVGFDLLEKFVPSNHGSTLKRLRIINGCHDTVIRYFFERFVWTAIELESHSDEILSNLPISVMELRLVREISMNDWLALVQRGKEGLLLRDLWLSLDWLEPAVAAKLLEQVVRDDWFVVYGISGAIQWHSTLNIWSQGSIAALSRENLSRAIRIVKDWNKHHNEVSCPAPLQVPCTASTPPTISSRRAAKPKVYVCPGRR